MRSVNLLGLRQLDNSKVGATIVPPAGECYRFASIMTVGHDRDTLDLFCAWFVQ